MFVSHCALRKYREFFGAAFLAAFGLMLSVGTSHAAIEAVRVATGFTLPLYVCAPPGDFGRIFVAEQHGLIKIVDLTDERGASDAFSRYHCRPRRQGQGTGILGMTFFDPDYAVNGHFYVSYTTDGDGLFHKGVSHIARYTVSADPNVADRTSRGDGDYCRSATTRS